MIFIIGVVAYHGNIFKSVRVTMSYIVTPRRGLSMTKKQERDSVSIRLSSDLSRSLSQALTEGGYITASEFVREAIRDKLRKMQEKE